MTDLSPLAIVQKMAKPLYSIIKVTGPFILSQSKTAVSNYSDFKLNKARLEAISILLQEEAKNISEDRAKLRNKMIDSVGLERSRAQNDYKLLTQELNKLSTIDKVKDFIGDTDTIDNTNEINDSWIDKFNQLASALNEEWRKQLLAKAFAIELKKPGTMSLIVLNCIASFDELSFRMFGVLVNSSIRMHGVNFISTFKTEPTFKILNNEYRLTTIIFHLQHLNLISFNNGGYINPRGAEVLLRYGRRVLTISYPHQKEVPPAWQLEIHSFTMLGNSIAELFDREPNQFGNESFDYLKENAKGKRYTCIEQTLSDQLYSELGD
ncbi:TPA: DUF2806 domain-containing protein [Klebsiella variicola subsp. variicola]|uniref:DUF2806 domain-containing protein n=1 Tax=Klebsiella variicola TaxID=244366 RepID=UPI000D74450F|nr:DUF2806 domain-containing protein [Klebsiella variicola]PXM41890.1 hypothetical protein DMT39_14695 [Klebsiella variicola]HBZ7767111.1 DUF2806 domain-containing protein [Klebsiella variicola subsp. variicola]HDU6184661.1 DUF2806 domain-containing protein [Klebsiella variicola]